MTDRPAEFPDLKALLKLTHEIESFEWPDAFMQLALLGSPQAYVILFRDGRIVIGKMGTAEDYI